MSTHGGAPTRQIGPLEFFAWSLVALVTDSTAKAPGEGIRGLIAKQQIATAVIDGMELFSA